MSKVLLLALITVSLMFSSCDNTGKMVEREWVVYNSVMDQGDIITAITCLNRIVAFEKYNPDALDTLAILYLKSGSNEAAAKIATRALNVRESDVLTKVLAKANKGLGKYDIALENYSKLLVKTPEDLELMYEVAYAYINLSRLNDALPFVQKIISHPESGSAVMQEFIKEGSQLLPYRAVAFNMLGFIQTQANEPEAAIKSYETALQIFPNYYLANNNLKLLSAKLEKK
ncbi:MAG: tetratricopeptide repeat protein [Flavobacteriales bacterium]|nr:tetratricopeptide repeat protein [Flavobacteriales bacterium]